MKSIWIIILLSNLLFTSAWADMFCPKNFNSINIGDSLDTVIKACGKPDAKKTSKKQPFQAQEWVYYIASYPGMQGTLKTTVAFDNSGKVVNISVNGAGLSETQICNVQGNNPTIQFGDTTDKIEAACGKPAYINQTSAANGAPKPTEITELQYNASPTTVTLVFENGKLTERK